MLYKSQKPPPGYQPGQTRAPLIWNITIPLAVIAVILACLRFYVRVCLVKVVGKDDWLLLAAVIFLCGLVSSGLWATSLGLGKHYYDLSRVREKDVGKLRPVCYFFFYALIFDFQYLGDRCFPGLVFVACV